MGSRGEKFITLPEPKSEEAGKPVQINVWTPQPIAVVPQMSRILRRLT
jgi:hypothetical protein